MLYYYIIIFNLIKRDKEYGRAAATSLYKYIYIYTCNIMYYVNICEFKYNFMYDERFHQDRLTAIQYIYIK